MMRLNLERVRANARQAATEDLLDRITVFRADMEPEALTVIEQELRARGVSAEAIREHGERRRQQGQVRSDGLAARCSVCSRPAVLTARRWHRLWGILPIFRRSFHYCLEHRPAELSLPPPGR